MRNFWKSIPLLLIVIVVCLALYRFGGIGGFVAYTRGEDVVISKVVDPKKAGPNIKIFNPTFDPVTVLSSSTTCNCVAISGLPHSVDAGESILLPVDGSVDEGVVVLVTLLVQDSVGIREKALELSPADFHTED